MVNATKPSLTRIRRIVDPQIHTVMGVDFSGAALAGKTAWAAEMVSDEPLKLGDDSPHFRLVSLKPLGNLAGSDQRDAVNDYLVRRISTQGGTFWGCDFPFGLPLELQLGSWPDQLSHSAGFDGSAKEFGLSLVARTEQILGRKHVRRTTDSETQTPFDCYHYRIIYQTFHGMRDVLSRVVDQPAVSILPFQYRKALSRRSRSIVVEACPASTLKRIGLPHQRYKQSGGKPPEAMHRDNRRSILRWIKRFVQISSHRQRVIMEDPGGDALDAVLAGIGSWLHFSNTDHNAIAIHSRYSQEGYVYC